MQTKIEKFDKVSILEASWKQIGELFGVLRYECYIDDQPEIDEVWEICEALVRQGGLEEEHWEVPECVDMLNACGYYAREAADLYWQYGRTDKYVRYLETHLDRESRKYVELAQYYYHAGSEAGAREIAEQVLEKCRDDLTELFIFLLQDAKSCKDEERYKKLYASAKRRKKAEQLLEKRRSCER